MEAKYKIIAEDLRKKILEKNYVLNSLLPSEGALQKQYEVSRYTIRQALDDLAKEGLIEKSKGSGSRVIRDYLPKKQQSLKTIGVITTYLSDYIFPDIIRGIEEVLQKNGYGLLLASTNNDFTQERNCLKKMLSYEVDGLLIEPTKSSELNPNLDLYLALKEKKIPILMLNAFYEEFPLPVVGLDDMLAGKLGTRYLIEQGHKKLALMVKTDDRQGKLRFKGFVSAHEEAGISFNSFWVFSYTTKNYEKVLKEFSHLLLEKNSGITGIICYNDEVAQDLETILLDNGKKIPEDFSLVGQDNSFLAKNSPIPITSVSHPKEELGKKAGEVLIEMINGKSVQENFLFTPEVINRKSVGKKQV